MDAREEAAFTQQRQQNETVLKTLEMLVLCNQGQEFRRRRTFHHDQRGRELKEIGAIGVVPVPDIFFVEAVGRRRYVVCKIL